MDGHTYKQTNGWRNVQTDGETNRNNEIETLIERLTDDRWTDRDRQTGHPESKERLRVKSEHLFCCSRSLISGVQCDDVKLSHAVVCRTLSRGKCEDSCSHVCTD